MSKKEPITVAQFAVALCLMPLVAVPAALLSALGLQCVWMWAVVPVFHAPPCSLLQAATVSLVCSALGLSYHAGEFEKQHPVASALMRVIVTLGAALVLGWLAQ